MSCEDGLFAVLLEMGGTGLISASGNIPEATKTFVELYKAFQAGDKNKAHDLQIEARDFIDITFCRKNPIPLGTLFNSPLFQPLVSVKDTAHGVEAVERIMKLINEKAPSLKKYHV